jgi:hypothetical protein
MHCNKELVMTKQDRQQMASEITEAMRLHYKEQGEEGDFADGLRYLANDASLEELRFEHSRWIKG